MAKQKTKNEKIEILKSIRIEYQGNRQLGIKRICQNHKITPATYYKWCSQEKNNLLEPISRRPINFGNEIGDDVIAEIVRIWDEGGIRFNAEVHRKLKSLGYKISYNTVSKIINKLERIGLDHLNKSND